jgi:hypothetical protein
VRGEAAVLAESMEHAILREKQLEGGSRAKKSP